jgi:hypothetical protein
MTTAPAGHPGDDDDPEMVFRSLLAADLRPVINAATTARMRAAAGAAGEHLCGRLHRDISGFTGAAALGRISGPPGPPARPATPCAPASSSSTP